MLSRLTPILLLVSLFVAFLAGANTAVGIKDVQRNKRIREINANVSRGITLLDKHYRQRAQPFTDIVDLAPSLRQENWGTGSCVFATSVSLLRWPGDPRLDAIADKWRRTYSGGEFTAGPPHTRKMDADGLRYVTTLDGDERLLEWACATRRGCGVAYPRGHCVALIGKVEKSSGTFAVLLDNNHPARYDYVVWSNFVREWKSLGGQAFAFVYDPPPPAPR